MTKTARVYGGSLYDLAAEEKLDGQIMEQMIAVRQIFRENPGYLKLLGEPAIPEDERLKMIEEAFGRYPLDGWRDAESGRALSSGKE